MARFNLNFIVVHDRISDSSLTVEDIKQVIKIFIIDLFFCIKRNTSKTRYEVKIALFLYF
jgi:hypothetical protein